MVKDNSFFKKSFYLLAVIGLSASMIIGCTSKTENNSEDTKVEKRDRKKKNSDDEEKQDDDKDVKDNSDEETKSKRKSRRKKSKEKDSDENDKENKEDKESSKKKEKAVSTITDDEYDMAIADINEMLHKETFEKVNDNIVNAYLDLIDKAPIKRKAYVYLISYMNMFSKQEFVDELVVLYDKVNKYDTNSIDPYVLYKLGNLFTSDAIGRYSEDNTPLIFDSYDKAVDWYSKVDEKKIPNIEFKKKFLENVHGGKGANELKKDMEDLYNEIKLASEDNEYIYKTEALIRSYNYMTKLFGQDFRDVFDANLIEETSKKAIYRAYGDKVYASDDASNDLVAHIVVYRADNIDLLRSLGRTDEEITKQHEELQTAIIYANKDDILWELLVKNISANIYKMFGDYERAETTYALNIYDFPNYIATYVPYAEILKDYSGDKDLSWDAKMMKKDLMNIPNIENNQTYIDNKALFDEVFTKYGVTD